MQINSISQEQAAAHPLLALVSGGASSPSQAATEGTFAGLLAALQDALANAGSSGSPAQAGVASDVLADPAVAALQDASETLLSAAADGVDPAVVADASEKDEGALEQGRAPIVVVNRLDVVVSVAAAAALAAPPVLTTLSRASYTIDEMPDAGGDAPGVAAEDSVEALSGTASSRMATTNRPFFSALTDDSSGVIPAESAASRPAGFEKIPASDLQSSSGTSFAPQSARTGASNAALHAVSVPQSAAEQPQPELRVGESVAAPRTSPVELTGSGPLGNAPKTEPVLAQMPEWRSVSREAPAIKADAWAKSGEALPANVAVPLNGGAAPKAADLETPFAVSFSGGAARAAPSFAAFSLQESVAAESSENAAGISDVRSVASSAEVANMPGAREAASSVRMEAPSSPAADRVPLTALADQVVRSVRYMAGREEQTIKVRLVPESLGEVHVQVTSSRDVVTVRLMSGNPVVREALESQASGLRDMLQREGIQAAHVQVAGDAGGQGAFGHMGRHAAAWMSQERMPSWTGFAEAPFGEDALEGVRRGAAARHDGALNVYV